jgi:prefoldin subunit 5
MTIQQIEEMTALDQTCAEVRQENAELRTMIAEMRHALGEVYKCNSLGKTKKIADLIYPFFKQ